MGSVALFVKHIRQAAVWRTRDTPRFVDRHSGNCATSGFHTIHTPVKVGVHEATRRQIFDYLFVFPISTAPRPFYKYPCTHADGVICDLLEGHPQPAHEFPMIFYLLHCFATAAKIHHGPHGAPSAWGRVPEGVLWATQV